LTSLQLSYSGPASIHWQDEPIELPSLEKLELAYDDSFYVSTLFCLLSMPNLKGLYLDLQGDYSEFTRQLAMPPRSVLPGLQHLRIIDLVRVGDLSTINAVYAQLVNLKSIYLECESESEGITGSFFTTFMKSFPGVLYCPNLTTIITSGISGEEM
jgi:hypothetical protein